MEQQKPPSGDGIVFKPKSNGDKQDCLIELEKCNDFGTLKLENFAVGQGNASLLSLRQMVKNGRPAVVIIVPPGVKFEFNTRDDFVKAMNRVGELNPVIMVFGGK